MQMNARNLATCFAPSLFDVCGRWKAKSSGGGRTRRRRARVEHGVLSEKDLEQHRAEHECLATMIVNAKDLFTVRSQLVTQSTVGGTNKNMEYGALFSPLFACFYRRYVKKRCKRRSPSLT